MDNTRSVTNLTVNVNARQAGQALTAWNHVRLLSELAIHEPNLNYNQNATLWQTGSNGDRAETNRVVNAKTVGLGLIVTVSNMSSEG